MRPNERELATYRANRSLGFRTLGGDLVLTDQRVIFDPHVADSAAAGKRWACELTSITNVLMSARGFNPLNGSLLPRLQIDADGASEYFVVREGFAIVDAIRQAKAH